MAENIFYSQGAVSAAERGRVLGQRGCVLWLTGLSGSGKSTVAKALEAELIGLGRAAYLLDGDNIRHGLNRDLGFSDSDRSENIRRIGEVAALFADAGLITLVAFISPFTADRAAVRGRLPEGSFFEVYVKASLEVCEGRDPKGLYAKARAGGIPGFTGIDSPYEPPPAPELTLDTAALNVSQAAAVAVEFLKQRKVF